VADVPEKPFWQGVTELAAMRDNIPIERRELSVLHQPPARQYYGVPGHCHDIDGFFWHDPGECIGAPVNCDGRCCGYIEKKEETAE